MRIYFVNGMPYFGTETGKTMIAQVSSPLFSGEQWTKMVEIEAYDIVPPGKVKHGMGTFPVPSCICKEQCGVGKALGRMWA